MGRSSRDFLLCALGAALLVACGAFNEEKPLLKRALVLYDDRAIKSTHSLFFKSLTDRGFSLDFRAADDSSLHLKQYGEYLYDALILFAPKVESLGGSLDTAAVLDFIDSGHDVILAAESGGSDVIRDIANDCGVDFDEDEKAVAIDHVSVVESDDYLDHTVVASNRFLTRTPILGEDGPKAPVLYRGIGMSISPTNDLVLPVLRGSPTALSHKPAAEVTKVPSLAGDSLVLVASMQARNNARVVVSGSLDLFSDKFFRSPVRLQSGGKPQSYAKSGNEEFAEHLSKWAFHEAGHLKASNVQHHHVGETEEPGMYRIKDQVEFSMEVHEWNGKSWVPFKGKDVQLEFYMMSAYIRKALETKGDGVFHTSFQVPDVYGVFQFKVNYNRPGYTIVNLAKQIPVRPFRHNEYERFITAAYPYYTSSFSMLIGFVLFGFVFLYNSK